MKKVLVLLFVAKIGCGPSSPSGQSPPNAPTASANPTKMTATELYDHYKHDKNMDGAKVEVSGIVRSVDDGRANGKIVLEGASSPST